MVQQVMQPVVKASGSEAVRRSYVPSEFAWIWVGTAALFAISTIIAPGTVTRGSLLAMLPFAGILAIVATGQTVVIQQRGLDMSAAGSVSLAGMLAAVFGYLSGSMLLGVAGALSAGIVVGLVNGFLSARMNITPVVETLAVNALFIGVIRTVSGDVAISAPPAMQTFSHGSLLGLPYSVWLALLFVCFAAFITKSTAIGRRFVAVGVNPPAATAAGVPVLRYQIGAYAVSAICFSVAGILLVGFLGNATQTAGNEYLLPSIAAVVLGGTPFTGGRGSVVASAVAALFLAQLSQLVLALGASSAVQLLVTALAILLATTIRLIPRLLGRRS